MSGILPKDAQGWNVLGAVGGLISGVGQMTQAGQEEKVGAYNAQIYNQQAKATLEAQKLLEIQKNKSIKSQIGTQVALYASSGVRMTGSPIEVMVDSLTNAKMDIAIDRYNANVKATGLRNQADYSQYIAKQKAAQTRLMASKSLLSTSADLWKSSQSVGTTYKTIPNISNYKVTTLGGGYKTNVPYAYAKPTF